MSSSEEFASADEEEGAGAHGPRAGRGGHGGGGSPDVKQADGWDDFDIDDEPEPEQPNREDTLVKRSVKPTKEAGTNEIEKDSDDVGDGWGKFDDWVQDNPTKQASEDPKKTLARSSEDEKIKSVADRLADISTKETPAQASSGWGWGGWGVDSLLSTATAGISSITSHVSQGISSVSNALETGIGAPDPEELAKRNIEAKEEKPDSPGIKPASQEEEHSTNYDDNIKKSASNEGAFALGSLMSGVSHITKFVESTGTKVIAGSLDTLETIGKKTMEVLQDGDPGLAKKRAMLGLDSGDKPVLSQVLREAKTKADEEDSIREQKREAKEVHYETLFDDFEGLVHLEALEMLSRQTSMRLEDRLRSVQADKRQEMKETLQQVAELCEMPDSDEEVDDVTTDHELTRPEILYNRLREATQDLGLSLQFQPLVRQFTDTLDWLSNSAEVAELEKSPEKCVYKKGVSTLAQCTALCVEVYHKTAEMLLVKQRRSTADEADALTQMTSVLTRHISELATVLTDKLNALSTVDSKEQVNTYITNIFLEAGNSSTYIQNAFQLTLPILQIGAA